MTSHHTDGFPLSHTLEIDNMLMEWSRETGSFNIMGIPAGMFWLNPSLLNMLTPLASEVGHDLFRLLVAHSSSLGVKEDYEAMVTAFADNFKEGFLKWGLAVSAVGWGRFEMPVYDKEARRAEVIVRNGWEIKMQTSSRDRWGCPFIQGKLIGLFSIDFGTSCWAKEVETSYEEGDQFVRFVIEPDTRTITSELELLRHKRAREREREELIEALAAMELARDEARHASEAKSQFLASMSHELRTPLNAILGYTELVREELLEQDLSQLAGDLSHVLNAGKHLLDLVSQVLELSRVESGRLELKPSRVNLSTHMESIERLARPLMGRHDNTFEVDATQVQGMHMVVDELRLTQILVNIVGNAAKFTEKGTITLTAHEQGDHIVWRVRDSGIGIAPEQIARIFHTFAQADASIQHRYGGTGLGLSISNMLATAMGGEIRVESAQGKGSCFELWLPRTP